MTPRLCTHGSRKGRATPCQCRFMVCIRWCKVCCGLTLFSEWCFIRVEALRVLLPRGFGFLGLLWCPWPLLGALRGFRISGLKCTEKGRGKLRRKLDSGVVIEFLVFGC